MTTSGLPTVRLLRIEGRVQGVGYRWWCAGEARALGLAGYVRNCRDGSVEALLQGPAAAVARMEALLERGPPEARVDRVVALPPPDALEPLKGFEQRPTA